MRSSQIKKINLPLMKNNIARRDLDRVIRYLQQDDPMLTHGKNVREFEAEWSKWLGVKYSVYVNSGASANLLTILALKETVGLGEIIVPPLTWVSDIASVLQSGYKPVFADINPQTLGMDTDQVLLKITNKTKAVFITHILGFNAFEKRLLDGLKARNIILIEDVCESHGATFNRRKLGTFGLASNFSFYYAHHMTTIEGGMVSTNDPDFYQMVRMLRSHGMVRESTSDEIKNKYYQEYPDLNPDFIFAFPGYNVRPTEIGAIIGRSQLKHLDRNNTIRSENLKIFLDNLDPDLYQTKFATTGSSNYAFVLILKNPDDNLRDLVMETLRQYGVEFRRGTSGGGNQMRQPYLKKLLGKNEFAKYPVVEHVHFYGFYIGNYPTLQKSKIKKLCFVLNSLK